jgi:hypothetical protein
MNNDDSTLFTIYNETFINNKISILQLLIHGPGIFHEKKVFSYLKSGKQ